MIYYINILEAIYIQHIYAKQKEKNKIQTQKTNKGIIINRDTKHKTPQLIKKQQTN